jgi:hypothetical protein
MAGSSTCSPPSTIIADPTIDHAFGINVMLPKRFQAEDVIGWQANRLGVLRASRQLQQGNHLELAGRSRRQHRRPPDPHRSDRLHTSGRRLLLRSLHRSAALARADQRRPRSDSSCTRRLRSHAPDGTVPFPRGGDRRSVHTRPAERNGGHLGGRCGRGGR